MDFRPGDARSGRVALVAHCLLNQNSVVAGLARYAGVVPGIAELMARYGVGVVQLPCPEMLHSGLRRFWQVREQYDNPGFRALARELSGLIARYVAEYLRNGVEVAVLVGVAGSPSCGVHLTSSGQWYGDPSAAGGSARVPGRGVFMEELVKALEGVGARVPMADFDHEDPEGSLRAIEGVLRGGR